MSPQHTIFKAKASIWRGLVTWTTTHCPCCEFRFGYIVFFLAVRFQLVYLKFQLDLIETVTLTNAWPAKRLCYFIYIFAFCQSTFTFHSSECFQGGGIHSQLDLINYFPSYHPRNMKGTPFAPTNASPKNSLYTEGLQLVYFQFPLSCTCEKGSSELYA